MRFFRKKAYGLKHIFVQSRIIIYHAKLRKKCLKKMSKKKGFHFLKLFFKNENWTFIFVHF